MNSSGSIKAANLDPVVLDLGLLVGLLQPVGGSDTDVKFNTEWFKDPLNNTAEGFRQNGEAMSGLLKSLLGRISGNALGAAAKDPNLLGDWYPIAIPSTDDGGKSGARETGLYVVSYKPEHGDDFVFALGTKHTWEFGSDPADLMGLELETVQKLDVTVYGLIPILKMGKDVTDIEAMLALGTAAQPISIGIQVDSPGGPLIDAANTQFAGAKCAVELSFTENPVRVALEVLGLKLPNEDKPSNRSLADLENLSATELIDTAASLLIAALGGATGLDDKVSLILPIFGIQSKSPLDKNLELPLIQWDQLIKAATSSGGDDIAAPFVEWFNALSAPDLMKGWLALLSNLILGEKVEITGTGSRADPFHAPILQVKDAGTLAFTVASFTDENGDREVYPGISFASPVLAVENLIGAQLAASLELFGFNLGPSKTKKMIAADVDGAPVIPALTFDLTLTLSGPEAGKPLLDETVGGKEFKVGALVAGMEIGDKFRILPKFQLVDVATPLTTAGVLDLTDVSKVAETAEGALEKLVDEALGALFGISPGDTPVPFASNIATLMGVIPPTNLPEGVIWPETLAPPFSGKKIIGSLTDPTAAFAAYWASLLNPDNKVGGVTPVAYLLGELAGMIRLKASGSAASTVSGGGTKSNPWIAPIAVDDAPAYLTAFEETTPAKNQSPGRSRLTIGLALMPEVAPASGPKIGFGVEFYPIAFDIDTTSFAVTGADWLPLVRASISLLEDVSTPEIFGTKFSVGSDGAGALRACSTSLMNGPVGMSASWGLADGWNWSTHVSNPTVTIAGTPHKLAGDLVFSDIDDLKKLVTSPDLAAQFSPVLVGVLGSVLTLGETRPGIAMTALFGLLPDIDSHLPEGLNWPKTAPQLVIHSFSAPQKDILAQLSALTKDTAAFKAAAELIAWTMNPQQSAIPTLSGSGTGADPYLLPVPGLGEIGVAFWADPAQSAFGVGLGAHQTASFGADLKVEISPAASLSLVEISLDPKDPKFLPFDPSLTLAIDAALTGVKPVSDVEIRNARFETTLTVSNGDLSMVPDAALDVSTDGGKTWTVYSASALTSTDLQALFQTALAAGVKSIGQTLAGNATFDQAYGLFALAGLTVPATGSDGDYGVNAGGWQALFADPLGYAGTRTLAIFSDPQHAGDLLALLLAMMRLPKIEISDAAPVLDTLAALGFVAPAQQGYAPRPQNIIAFLNNPVQTLAERFTALTQDNDAARALQTQLSASKTTVPFSIFEFTATAAGRVSIDVAPGMSFELGGGFSLGGSVAFDLQSRQLSAELDCVIGAVGAVVGPSMSLTVPASGTVNPVFGVAVSWDAGTGPAPVDLPIYPFDPTVFVTRLADLAPRFAVSAFATAVLNSNLASEHPLAIDFFRGLGLVVEVTGYDGKKTHTLRQISGLFEDPIQWFESLDLFNIKTLNSVLTSLTPTSLPMGLGLVAVPEGRAVEGLPYGMKVAITANPRPAGQGDGQVGLRIELAEDLEIAKGKATFKAYSDPGGDPPPRGTWVGLTLGENFQPGFAGNMEIAGSAPGDVTLDVSTGFDGKSFTLSAGTDGSIFQIVPFISWTDLIAHAVGQAAQAAIKALLPQILDTLEKQPKLTKLVGAMRTAGTDLELGAFVQQLIDDATDLTKLEKAALDWLRDRIDPANAAKTSEAIAAIINALSIPSLDLTVVDGLITYKPSEKVPVVLMGGLDTVAETARLGLWVEFDYTAFDILKIGVTRSGIGINTSGDLEPDFLFGTELILLADGVEGPGLSFSYDTATGGLKLDLDPLAGGPEAGSQTLKLLPELLGVSPSAQDYAKELADALGVWVAGVLLTVLPRYAVNAILGVTAVETWMERGIVPVKTDGTTEWQGPTPGAVLSAAEILVDNGTARQKYTLNSLTALKQLTIHKFLARFFIALLSEELRLLKIGEKGGIFIAKPEGTDPKKYGLRVQIPDINLDAAPNVTFQIGADDEKWIENIVKDTADAPESGLSVLLPIADAGPNFSDVELKFINLGIDVHGKGTDPLVNSTRFKLGEIKPRALLVLDFSTSEIATWFGGAVDVGDIQISLAPNAVTGGSNQVAQNLLGSGGTSDKGGEQQAGKNQPVDPGFSFRPAFLNYPGIDPDTHEPKVFNRFQMDLFSDDGSPETDIWINVQRTFGPLTVNRIGFSWRDNTKQFGALFDGGLNLFTLAASVQKLEVLVPVTDPTDYSKYGLDLQGLDVSMNGAAVSITGGFLKSTIDNSIFYTGAASAQAGGFGLVAAGSYGLIKIYEDNDPNKKLLSSAPSLFVFAALTAPLGGPPAFFIMGGAGGLAFNRRLILPDISEIHEFPLVQGAVDPSFFAGDGADKALQKLQDNVPPQMGQYWIAAGIKFTSFKVVDGLAMVIVQFGREFELDIIGVATITQPPQSGSAALIYLELALIVSFKPAEGVFSFRAQLTPNSYVLVKECHITGGFAFVLWFLNNPNKKISAGDFVVTLGGYSPHFDKPKHYPDVPRVGLNWQVLNTGDISLSVKGGVYMALTPSAFMVGGSLEAMFKAGPIRAWFIALADFLIGWQPFFYVAEISITVGVGFQGEFLGAKIDISVSLGATLFLTGPRTHGYVDVDFFIINFTIPFGDGEKPGTKPLCWDKFAAHFLTHEDQGTASPAEAMLAVANGDQAQDGNVVKANSKVSPLDVVEDGDDKIWTLVSSPVAIDVTTSIPPTKVTVAGGGDPITGPPIGVQPMHVEAVKTPFSITLKHKNKEGEFKELPLSSTGLNWAKNPGGAPKALWSQETFDPETAPPPKMIDDTIAAIALTGEDALDGSEVGPMNLEALKYVTRIKLPLAFADTPDLPAAPAMPQGDFPEVVGKLMSTIMDADTVVPKRTAIFAALNKGGLPTPTTPDLSVMAKFADQILQAAPVLGAPAESLIGRPAAGALFATAPVKKAPPPAPEDAREAVQPRSIQLASLHRYRVATQPARPDHVTNIFLETAAPHHRTQGQRRLRATGSAGRAASLRTGDYTLWSVADGLTARFARHDDTRGQLRVVAVNALSKAVQDQLFSPDETEISVAPGATLIAVQNAGDRPAEGLVGWRYDDRLFQISRKVYLGDGFAVIGQHSALHRAGGRLVRRGLRTPAAIMAGDVAQGLNGEPVQGWTRTRFAGPLDGLIVLSTGDTPPELAEPDPDGGYRNLEITVDFPNSDSGETAFFVPLADAYSHRAPEVLTRAQGNSRITALFGVPAGIEAPADNWAGLPVLRLGQHPDQDTRPLTADLILT